MSGKITLINPNYAHRIHDCSSIYFIKSELCHFFLYGILIVPDLIIMTFQDFFPPESNATIHCDAPNSI